jgi:rhodanese-related sulfurtransferase
MPTTTTRPPKIVAATPAQLKRYFAAKLAAELGPHNVKRLIESASQDFVILDVRAAKGFQDGHIPGAINIPFEELPDRLQELPKRQEILCYCWDVTCTLSTKAAYVLASKGWHAREIVGGIEAWQSAGFPIQR